MRVYRVYIREETAVHFGPDMRDQIVHLSQMLICGDIYTCNRILCLNMMLLLLISASFTMMLLRLSGLKD